MWDATPEALAEVPPSFRVSYSRDRLLILERTEATAELDSPAP
jgi:hypothetical protein